MSAMVCPRRFGASPWLEILCPLSKISTLLSVMRELTSSRNRRGRSTSGLDFDVVVRGDAAAVSERERVVLVRQRRQPGPVDLGEEPRPARTEAAYAACVRIPE